MKRFLKAPAAFALAAVLAFGGAGAAYATDEATPAPEVSAEAEVTPTEAPAVEEAVVPEEVAAPAPAEVVETPEVTPAPAEPQAEVKTTDAQPQAPPVAAKTAPQKTSVCTSHGGSDGVTPYSVTAEGITLPAGCFFEDNGHVNIKTSVGPKNIHFESRNNQPSGQWIGKSFLPWSAFGLSGDFCVSWVQMSAFNEHFGEGGQKPVCTNPPFQVKEVCATWETKSVTQTWPQTILSKDCNYVPEQRCEAYQIQFDKYWIRDAKDQAYFDSLKGLNSAADDQSLEPHGYYVKVIPAKDCFVPKPVAHVQDYVKCDGAAFVLDALKSNVAITYDINGTKFEVPAGKAVHTDANGAALIQPVDGKYTVTASYGDTQLWSKTFKAKTDQECTVVVPPRHNANANGEYACGTAEVTLYNQQGPRESALTASFVIYVDGKFHSAHAVMGGEQEVVKFSFPEDSGNHQIIVRTGPAQGDEFVFSLDVPSDCIPPQPEPKVVTTEWADGEYACEDTTVTQTRTITTTTFKWDAETKTYVEDKVTTKTETRDRELTEQERQDACVKPEPTSGVEKRDTTPVCVEPNNGTATVEHQERTWTQTPVWNGTNWELSEKSFGDWVTVSTSTIDSEDCIPTKPDTKVEYSNWVDGKYDCDATEVPRTQTKTVTEYVWDSEAHLWVAQEPVVTTETGSRPLTEAEQEAADIECAGPQPENKVVFGEWKDSEYQCGDTTVQQTRTVTSTEFIREGAEWVEGESVTTYETSERTLTAEEIAELECPVVVPPTEEPPVVTPPVDTPKTPAKAPVEIAEGEDFLATTGGDATPLWIGGIALLLAGAGIYLATRRTKVDAE